MHIMSNASVSDCTCASGHSRQCLWQKLQDHQKLPSCREFLQSEDICSFLPLATPATRQATEDQYGVGASEYLGCIWPQALLPVVVVWCAFAGILVVITAIQGVRLLRKKLHARGKDRTSEGEDANPVEPGSMEGGSVERCTLPWARAVLLYLLCLLDMATCIQLLAFLKALSLPMVLLVLALYLPACITAGVITREGMPLLERAVGRDDAKVICFMMFLATAQLQPLFMVVLVYWELLGWEKPKEGMMSFWLQLRLNKVVGLYSGVMACSGDVISSVVSTVVYVFLLQAEPPSMVARSKSTPFWSLLLVVSTALLHCAIEWWHFMGNMLHCRNCAWVQRATKGLYDTASSLQGQSEVQLPVVGKKKLSETAQSQTRGSNVVIINHQTGPLPNPQGRPPPGVLAGPLPSPQSRHPPGGLAGPLHSPQSRHPPGGLAGPLPSPQGRHPPGALDIPPPNPQGRPPPGLLLGSPPNLQAMAPPGPLGGPLPYPQGRAPPASLTGLLSNPQTRLPPAPLGGSLPNLQARALSQHQAEPLSMPHLRAQPSPQARLLADPHRRPLPSPQPVRVLRTPLGGNRETHHP